MLKSFAKKIGFRRGGAAKASDFRQGYAYGIDRLVWLNGFGAFVSGWLFSPGRHVRGMSLVVGGRVLEADKRCLIAKSRADLAESFPDYADAVSMAGFDAIFRGPAPENGVGKPFLRLHMDDGVSVDLRIAETAIRLCDNSEIVRTLGWSLPSLGHEPFLDVFLDALAGTIKRRASDILPVAATKARSVVLIALPQDWHDVFLVTADVLRSVETLPDDVGFVFLMTSRHVRVRVLDRVYQLGRAAGRSIGLYEIKDPSYALWSVVPLLRDLESERFCFFGPNVVPTREGWQAAASFFAEGRSGCELFLQARETGGLSEPESLGFGWNARAFAAWIASAPFFLAGFHRDNHLPAAPPSARHDGAIGLLRTMVGPDPIRRADERLYEATPDRIEA